ncbi:FkbM family methyltransferase [Chelatococcus caeni]|uniref:FkbM family methyltransferase n=1 Tax=Chelatococcus caeni TaxID=1348468 RepID=A0A840C023_9HYPH|nr:FkbM family methyltransferase [Chelatococcus caeni]
MIKAGFVSSAPEWAWWRQFPEEDLVWDGVQFVFGGDLAGCDCCFVFDALPQAVEVPLDRCRLVFVASEPQNVKRYNAAFLDQFGTVLTTDRDTAHGGRRFTQVGLPWHVGAWSADGSLLAEPLTVRDFETFRPEKTKLVSVVSSNKAFTEEHRARLRFVAELKEHFGDQMDVFGRGINDFGDKLQVLAPYWYHIALENCAIDDYWTEKLADPFLTLTYPIYHGCRNIGEYFPEGSFTAIDIYDPAKAIETIKRVIQSDEAERAQPLLEEARRRVLYEHNLFALLARVARDVAQEPLTAGVPISVLPEEHFQSAKMRARRRLVQLLKRAPALHRAAKGARDGWKSSWVRSKDFARKMRDIHYRSHQAWLRDEPEERIRYAYKLNATSHVLDVGGFRGDFAARLIGDFGANVTVFEPIPQFADIIRSRFSGDPRVNVIEAALAERDGEAKFSIDDDASGAFVCEPGALVDVRLIDAARYLDESPTREFDLAKLNIEGGEYALLERLVATGHIKRIKDLQIQFHLNVPNARRRYRSLARELRRTHRLAWRYPFVWEGWTRRSD